VLPNQHLGRFVDEREVLLDRRIRRTEQVILGVFVELLAENGFDKITIRDVAERADVNRGTIYLHYADKYDLLDRCIQSYVDPLLEHCLPSTDSEIHAQVLQGLFGYVEAHLAVFRLFLRVDVIGFFRSRVSSTLGRALDLSFLRPGGSDLSLAAISAFFTSGFVGILEWWVNSPEPCNAQEVTDQVHLLIEPFRRESTSGPGAGPPSQPLRP